MAIALERARRLGNYDSPPEQFACRQLREGFLTLSDVEEFDVILKYALVRQFECGAGIRDRTADEGADGRSFVGECAEQGRFESAIGCADQNITREFCQAGNARGDRLVATDEIEYGIHATTLG